MRLRSPTASRAAAPNATLAQRTGASVVVLFMCTSTTACAGSKEQQRGAQSPERQSDAEYDIALDLAKKGNVRVALDHVQKAVSLNDENDKAHYLLASLLLSFCAGPKGFEGPECKLAEAEKSARAAIKANPEFRDGKNLLGQILINEKKYKEAIATLEPLTKDPAYVHPYLSWGNLGWAQVLDGQLDAGIISLKNAVAEPRFCVGHYRLGVAFEKKGDVGQAEQGFTNAVSVDDPSCTNLQDAWEARARVRIKLGKQDDARKDYERCVQISKETQTGMVCVRELAKLPVAVPSSAPANPAPSPMGAIEVNPNATRKM